MNAPQTPQIQARADSVGTPSEVRLAIRRDRWRAACDNADVDAVARNHLSVQPWQMASLPELLEMIEQTKTAPALTDEAR